MLLYMMTTVMLLRLMIWNLILIQELTTMKVHRVLIGFWMLIAILVVNMKLVLP